MAVFTVRTSYPYPKSSTITLRPATLQVLTVEFVVDFGSGLRWGKPTVLGV